jgi:hypothetical protein
MKRTTTLLAVLLCIAASTTGQIVIQSTDMPSTGDTLRMSSTSQVTGLTPAQTGAGITWDYSTLVADSQTVDTFVTTLSTGLYALNFSTASFARKSNTPSVSLSGIALDYQYDFFRKTASSYVVLGFGASVSGLPVGVVNTPKDTLYRFPLAYGDTGSCTTTFSVSLPGVGYYGGTRTRVDTVDGWGTLITSYGTHSVLRVKSYVTETDTVFISTLGFGLRFPLPPRTEYRWLATGGKEPLLQIATTAGAVSEVLWRDSLRTFPTGIRQPEPLTVSAIYPNPATQEVVVTVALAEKTDLECTLLNVTGARAGRFFFSGLEPGTHALRLEFGALSVTPGIYVLQCRSGQASWTGKLVVSP